MDSICINAFANAYFGQLVRDYQVPRRGPNWTRYAESDLDLWMRDPTVFMRPRRQSQPRKGGLFR